MIRELLDTLAAMAEMDPLRIGLDGEPMCRLCDAAARPGEVGRHADECLWAKNRRAFTELERGHLTGTLTFVGAWHNGDGGQVRESQGLTFQPDPPKKEKK